MIDFIASNLGLKKLNAEKLEAPGAWKPCFTIKAINYTPWWGGDYEGKVRDPKTLVPVSMPTSETIKGVLRWVLRAALNAYFDETIKELDEKLAILYGGVIRRNGREEHLDSLLRIRVEGGPKGADLIANYLGDLVVFIKQKVSKPRVKDIKDALQDAVRKVCSRCDIKDCQALKEYLVILQVPRVELALMPRSEEKSKPDKYVERVLSQLPVPPGEIEVSINVDAKIGLERITELGGFYVHTIDACKLTLVALIYTLIVHGLGRGSSRGFGRFKITNISIHIDDLKETKDKAMRLLSEIEGDNEGSNAEKALKELHNILKDYARILAYGQQVRASPQLLAPSLGHTHVQVQKNIHVSNIYEALYIIGCATLKQKWKYIGKLNIFSSGVNLHTWILGLPRWQQETGYAFMDSSLGVDVCVPVDYVKEANAGRRKSSLIIFPLPSGKLIAIVAYKTQADHKAIISRLYHVGAHTDNVPNHCLTKKGVQKRMQGKRLSPADVKCRHAVRIDHVLQSKFVGPGIALEDNCKGCCGNDAGGVRLLGGTLIAPAYLVNIYNQVIDYVTELLSRCTPPKYTSAFLRSSQDGSGSIGPLGKGFDLKKKRLRRLGT